MMILKHVTVSVEEMYEGWLSENGYYDLPYVKDIHVYMKHKELKRALLMRSPQLYWRSHLITLIKSICKDLKLSILVFHLSILLMDHFMDNHSIVDDKLRPIALACLSIAAKYEELDDKIPKMSDLTKYCNHVTGNQMRLYETTVVEHFGWQLGAPTAAHFILYYAQKALPSICEHLRPALNASMLAFLEVSIYDPTMMQYKSSEVAAACVLCGRQKIGLSPIWTTYLTRLTGYSHSDLSECQTHLMSSIQIAWVPELTVKRKSEGSDNGYESMSPVNGQILDVKKPKIC